MSSQKIKIRLYTELRDNASVLSAINKLDTMDFELINSDSKDFIIDRNDIAIIHIDNLESNLLSKLIDLRTSLRTASFLLFRMAKPC